MERIMRKVFIFKEKNRITLCMVEKENVIYNWTEIGGTRFCRVISPSKIRPFSPIHFRSELTIETYFYRIDLCLSFPTVRRFSSPYNELTQNRCQY